ncbi:hypothetical protein [Mycobacterium sp. OTB74]|jgi:hypothetical protein|uniref:hypothetical protein n=1 Tax=Mycobacterium sp. OTB74 TaxID=1853452 RepID=UPI002475044A|nr:hypothetical protein [Mycobacterium sp. OTB74]MDH6245168.1 hypothetical protein [Mycobacterium sp. OTB74]
MPFTTSLQARAAVHESWARTPDRAARTAKARAAVLANLEREVDPDHRMSPQDRARAVENRRQARQLAALAKGMATRARKKAALADPAIRAAAEKAMPRCGRLTTKGKPCRQQVKKMGWACTTHGGTK